MITSLGSLTLAVAVPGAAAGAAAGVDGINGALPDIDARIAALAAFSPSPGNFPADIALAEAIIASIEAAIAEGLTPPSLSAQIAAVAALVATLEAQAVAINVNLQILIDLQGVLATAGVSGYVFDGAQNVLGSELATALGGSTAHANAVILVTQSGATFAAMSALFKVTP